MSVTNADVLFATRMLLKCISKSIGPGMFLVQFVVTLVFVAVQMLFNILFAAFDTAAMFVYKIYYTVYTGCQFDAG